MSLDDIKAIDWARPSPAQWPRYIQVSVLVFVFGIVLVLVSFFV
jgi:hypothetical protein